MAAVQGDGVAQCNLAMMYEAGEGVPQDEAQAMEWFRRAAAHGNADAKERLKAMGK